jgi:hypothetical protein
MKQASERLGVKIVGGLKEVNTPWAGSALLVDLFRKLEMDKIANKVLPAKRSSKGLNQGQMIETFILLSALGGENIDDVQHIRDDAGLAGIMGYTLPAPEAARQWLDSFHDEALMLNRPLQGSFIPPESQPLVALKEIDRQTIWAYVNNVKPKLEVTLDVDTQLIETNKTEARYCYAGYKAFQAMKVSWAETLLVLNDELSPGECISPQRHKKGRG